MRPTDVPDTGEPHPLECSLSIVSDPLFQASSVTYYGRTPTRTLLVGQKMTEEYHSRSGRTWYHVSCKSMTWT